MTVFMFFRCCPGRRMYFAKSAQLAKKSVAIRNSCGSFAPGLPPTNRVQPAAPFSRCPARDILGNFRSEAPKLAVEQLEDRCLLATRLPTSGPFLEVSASPGRSVCAPRR